MSLDWYRSYHGAPTDPKWLAVAARAKVPPGVVSAVWFALEDCASQAENRGSVAGFDCETYAAFAGWSEDDVGRVLDALRVKKLIVAGRLAAWERRQPKREDDRLSTDRVRAFRERQKQSAPHETTRNHPKPPDESREEEKRVEEREDGSPLVPGDIKQPSSLPRRSAHTREEAAPLPLAAEKGAAAAATATATAADFVEQPHNDSPTATEPKAMGLARSMAIAEMRNDLYDALLEHLDDPQRRRSFRAAANLIVTGDQEVSWRDPTGSVIPWPNRPALFRAALARCAGDNTWGSNALHSALRYVIPQHLAPHPAPMARHPDTEAGRVRDELPGRERAPGGSGFARVAVGAEAAPRRAEEAAGEQEDERSGELVEAWRREHPNEAERLAKQVAVWAREMPEMPEPAKNLAIRMEYKRHVLARIRGLPDAGKHG